MFEIATWHQIHQMALGMAEEKNLKENGKRQSEAPWVPGWMLAVALDVRLNPKLVAETQYSNMI